MGHRLGQLLLVRRREHGGTRSGEDVSDADPVGGDFANSVTNDVDVNPWTVTMSVGFDRDTESWIRAGAISLTIAIPSLMAR